VLAAVAVPAGSQARPTANSAYTLRLLQPLAARGDNSSEAKAINAFGTAVGSSSYDPVSLHTHATQWNPNGSKKDMGVVSGFTYFVALSVNAYGHATGWSARNDTSGGAFSPHHPVRWKGGGQVTDLMPAGPDGIGNAINDFDTIVGTANDPRGSGGNVAIVIARDGVIDQRGPEVVAWSISDRGTFVGSRSVDNTGMLHATIWRDSGNLESDLGTVSGMSTEAKAINLFEHVAGEGYSNSTGYGHGQAFIWRNGAMNPIPNLPYSSYVSTNTINNNDEIVGSYTTPSGRRAWLWRKGKPIDLNTLLPAGSDPTLTSAAGINDLGQIAGTAKEDGHDRGFVLSPPPRTEAANVLAVARKIAPRNKKFQRRVSSSLGTLPKRKPLHAGCRSLEGFVRYLRKTKAVTQAQHVTLLADVLGLEAQAAKCRKVTHL